jgi:hypothetical protein
MFQTGSVTFRLRLATFCAIPRRLENLDLGDSGIVSDFGIRISGLALPEADGKVM